MNLVFQALQPMGMLVRTLAGCACAPCVSKLHTSWDINMEIPSRSLSRCGRKSQHCCNSSRFSKHDERFTRSEIFRRKQWKSYGESYSKHMLVYIRTHLHIVFDMSDDPYLCTTILISCIRHCHNVKIHRSKMYTALSTRVVTVNL